MNEARYMALIC